MTIHQPIKHVPDTVFKNSMPENIKITPVNIVAPIVTPMRDDKVTIVRL